MKILIISFICSFLMILNPYTSYAQVGPGGVGSASNIEIWLDASKLSLNNNDPVSTFTDKSGNSNDATQPISANQPVFLTNQLNGYPVVSFDGTNDFFDFTSNITSGDISIIAVYNSTKTSRGGLLHTQKHVVQTENNYASAFYLNPSTLYKTYKPTGQYSVFSLQTDGSVSGSSLNTVNGNSQSTFTRTEVSAQSNSRLGRFGLSYLQGFASELIIFNEILNSAKRKLVSNYLAAKYNLTGEDNLFTYKTIYNNDVKGVGQESDGSHTSSRGTDSLEISNPATLDDGDYFMIGNDAAGYGTDAVDVPGGIVERWNQVWRADVTGSPGNVDLKFFLGTNGFATSTDYVVLIDAVDSDFSNGGTSVHLNPNFNVGENSVSFSGVNIPDGYYFTLAESEGEINAVATGDWNSTSTWSCNCIPGLGEIVKIVSPFGVTVSTNSSVGNLTIESGASLNFSGNDTLFVDGNIVFETSASFTSGTIAAVSTGVEQSFTNNSGTTITFNNLYSSNPNSLMIVSGDWGISNNLQVIAGDLDVTATNSFTLISNSSETSQILPSIANAFTGDYTVQRYIGPRNANYANMSSSIENATVADWDDDLFLSGVGGNNGTAYKNGGGIFRSIYRYNRVTDQHEALVSISDNLIKGLGYEVWLADNQSTFNGATIDLVGIPNSGNAIGAQIDQGWNLLGNPYHSFIEYDSIKTSVWIPDNYYIFNTDNGSYDFFNGPGKPAIAPGQGFWIRKISGGTKTVDFREEGKVNSVSSSFLRKKAHEDFELQITDEKNNFKHKSIIKFDLNSTDKIDDNDAFYLNSPIVEAPALYMKASNSEEGLIMNSINPSENHHKIPLEIYAGVDGNFNIQTKNLEKVYENYSCVYLQDLKDGKTIDLSVAQSYSFVSKKGTEQRFNLFLSDNFDNCEELFEMNIVSQTLENNLQLRNSNGTWNLDYTLDKDQNRVEIRVYSISGSLALKPISFSVSGSGTWPLHDLNSLHGLYLIQVISRDEILSKKIKL